MLADLCENTGVALAIIASVSAASCEVSGEISACAARSGNDIMTM
jgi:hypothetical protein